jgi:hypothetical protein
MPGVIFLDSFSGDLADLKPKMRTTANALAVLSNSPRVSIWDMDKQWLRSLVLELETRKFIVPKAEGYPWLRWEITEAGMQFLRSNSAVTGA